jgi:hypothetical protein
MDYLSATTPPAFANEGAAVRQMPGIRRLAKSRTRRYVSSSETTSDGFTALAEVWEREARNSSDIRAITSHWAYRAIIRMGPPVVPRILARMRDHGGFWFAALEEIAKWDPVLPEAWGNTREMADAWFKWWSECPDANQFQDRGPGIFLQSVPQTE